MTSPAPRRRNKGWQILTNVEEEVFDLVEAYGKSTGQSNSAIVRSALIRDLIDRGLMTPALIQKLLVK